MSPDYIEERRFHCLKIHADLTPSQCGALHAKARKRCQEIACRTCQLGAQNAGMSLPKSSAGWQWSDFKPGDEFVGIRILDRRGFSFQAQWRVWVEFIATGEQVDMDVTTVRRWMRSGQPQKGEPPANRRGSFENHRVTIGDKEQTVLEWCAHFRINYGTVYDRRRRQGLDWEECFTRPVQRRRVA